MSKRFEAQGLVPAGIGRTVRSGQDAATAALDELPNYDQGYRELLLLTVTEVSLDWLPSCAADLPVCAIRISG